MKYRIIAFYDDVGVVAVDFGSGVVVNMDLPIVNNRYPLGEELDKFIQSMYPAAHMDALAARKNVENAEFIRNLVEAPEIEEIAPAPVDHSETMDTSEQEAIIRQGIVDTVYEVLRKENLCK